MIPVNIFVVSFKNLEVLRRSLDSYASQDYENLSITIFDNASGDNYSATRDLVFSRYDSRFKYVSNIQNIGPRPNYMQCFSSVQPSTYSMIMAADMAFSSSTSITKLVNAMESSNCSIVYPRSYLTDTSLIQPGMLAESQAISLNHYIYHSDVILEGSKAASDLIRNNRWGEYNSFCFAGALINSNYLLGRLSSMQMTSASHGGEYQLDLILLIYAPLVFFSSEYLLHCYTGHPRLGGSERLVPPNTITRVAPLLAMYDFLRSYDTYFLFKGIAPWRLYSAIALEALYTIVFFRYRIFLLLLLAACSFGFAFLYLLP